MAKKTYECEVCHLQKKVDAGKPVPEHCGRPMALKMEACTKPFDAETARQDDSDEPCNDGTGRNT
jgi:hypothetical protein